MKAYSISSDLKDFIVAEQDCIYADSRRLWSPWSPIEGSDYLGLAENELTEVLNLLLKNREFLLGKNLTWDSQPIKRNKEMFQEVTDLIFQ